MNIYLLRHGETEYNKQKRYQGTLDIPLSAEGLARLQKAPISPKVVYISPLIRARHTAEILFPDAKLVEVEDLKEMCFGVFQGRNYIEMEKDPDYIAWVGEDCTGRCPGGETKAEFTRRTCEAFCRLLEDALEIVKHANELVGCRVVRVDCLDELIPYYEQHGFRYLCVTDPTEDKPPIDQMVQII